MTHWFSVSTTVVGGGMGGGGIGDIRASVGWRNRGHFASLLRRPTQHHTYTVYPPGVQLLNPECSRHDAVQARGSSGGHGCGSGRPRCRQHRGLVVSVGVRELPPLPPRLPNRPTRNDPFRR